MNPLTLAALLALAACGPPPAPTTPTPPPTDEPTEPRQQPEDLPPELNLPREITDLESLTVADPVEEGYDRKQWKHWIDEDGDCQDTRQEVLIAESEVEVTFKTEKNCKVATGRWWCLYTNQTFTDPRKLDVGHLVPLGAAHAAGGHAWDADRKKEFANELEFEHHLIAVKASANRSKGKKGPEQWLPDNGEFVCEYLSAWVNVKAKWELSMNSAEKDLLVEKVYACMGLEPPEE